VALVGSTGRQQRFAATGDNNAAQRYSLRNSSSAIGWRSVRCLPERAESLPRRLLKRLPGPINVVSAGAPG
jgi:hypothetical protein